MKYLKFTFILLLITSITIYAGGTASLVAKKSNTKGFSYSISTRLTFIQECSENANQDICYCVLNKIQQQYSEKQYLKLDADLRKKIDHPDFVTFISKAANTCDEEYALQANLDLIATQEFANNNDIVLKDETSLQTTDKITSRRRHSRAYEDSEDDYVKDNFDGIGDGLAGLLGGGGGGIATKAKGSIKTPSMRDIDIEGSRSAADIMKVVRQRTPGLRHIYNKCLKEKPGFQGKVTLKFTIAPGGEIISISTIYSTTGFSEFDSEIKNAVSRWTFNKVQSGNSTVTIPFTFIE
ncbi:TonB family protein [Fibrobacter sp.]|uniref:AgmX/PglI C-terminal domain-containing protein n=1 Tax=Fibrobacter sp. TaxID=35828 RepID=UPI003865F5AF